MSGLVLQRCEGESCHIVDNVTVTLIECRNGSARLLIDAPREWPITRDETINDDALRIKRANEVTRKKHELYVAENKLKAVTKGLNDYGSHSGTASERRIQASNDIDVEDLGLK